MKTEREMTCIICPRGCSLRVVLEDGRPTDVSGYTCPRGRSYAETECTHPTRTLTTTVRTADGGVLPCKTDRPIPKEKLFAAMAEANAVVAPAGTRAGDILLRGICGEEADLVATESVR